MTPPAERMFGNHCNDKFPCVLSIVCTGPEKSNKPINTNARTYVGIANGSIKAQLNILRPGKSHTAVSHAEPTPRTKVPASTPEHNINVFFSKSTNRVSTICRHMSDCGCSTDEKITRIGMITDIAATTAIDLKLIRARIFFRNTLCGEYRCFLSTMQTVLFIYLPIISPMSVSGVRI